MSNLYKWKRRIPHPQEHKSPNIIPDGFPPSDDVKKEAEQLLSSWSKKKIWDSFIESDPMQDIGEIPEQNEENIELLAEYLSSDVYEELEKVNMRVDARTIQKNSSNTAVKFKDNLYNRDGFDQSKKVLKNLQSRDYISKTNRNRMSEVKSEKYPLSKDLGFRMDVRHDLVKNNRERRLTMNKMKKEEKKRQKVIEEEAKLIVEEELMKKKKENEKEKKLIEEYVKDIEKNMKKENELLQKTLEEKLKKNEKFVEKGNVKWIREEFTSDNQIDNGSEILELNSDEENKLNEIVGKLNLEILRLYFGRWRNCTKENKRWNEQATSKAKVVYEFNLQKRILRKWYECHMNEKVEMERHELEIREFMMQTRRAVRHYEQNLCKKVLNVWLYQTKLSITDRQIRGERDRTRAHLKTFILEVEENKEELLEAKKRAELAKEEKRVELAKEEKILNEIQEENRKRIKSAFEKERSEILEKIRNDNSKLGNCGKWKMERPTMNNAVIVKEQRQLIEQQNRMIRALQHEDNIKVKLRELDEIKEKQKRLEHQTLEQMKQDKQYYQKQLKSFHEKKKPKSFRKNSFTKKEDNDEDETIVESSIHSITDDMSLRRSVMKKNELSNQQKRFMSKMEKRAKERQEMKEERLKRKLLELKRCEEEKQKKLEEELKKDEEEKKLLQFHREENRRRLKEEEKRKEKMRMEENEKNEKADKFYKRHLLNYYGMRLFKELMTMKRENMKTADNFHRLMIMKLHFHFLLVHTKESRERKLKKLELFHTNHLVRRYWNQWKQLRNYGEHAVRKADRFYVFHLKFKYFRVLHHFSLQSKRRTIDLKSAVCRLHERHLMKNCFTQLRLLPSRNRRREEREKNLFLMKQKVRQLLPDFTTSQSTESIDEEI
ncbi:hypothetical protein SNEBB_007478 [Seison nebaliae]|nr:hypothetical protein SNEBB_007478 [Seison nebaliae]